MPQVLSQLVVKPKLFLSKADLQKFSLCCIQLQGLTLSDIATSSGKEIDSQFWKGHRSSQKFSLRWPHQIWPSSTCWQYGARPSTYYSQTQSGSPEFSQHTASTVGSPTCCITNFGIPVLIPLPPYSSPNLQRGTAIESTPLGTCSITTELPQALPLPTTTTRECESQSHTGSHLRQQPNKPRCVGQQMDSNQE